MAVFYSFHYDRDAWRVQQIMRMGQIEGQPLLNAQDWEAVKRRGEIAVQRWIDEQMKYKTAVVVLVGAQTASRKWVRFEIEKAWNERRPLVGIRVHGLHDNRKRADAPGLSPFDSIGLQGGGNVGQFVPLFSPAGHSSQAIYADIQQNLASWVQSACKRH